MSDTIIVYEKGKAIGGEGHPTDADDITFNNTGTDIVANKVGSAIKEVNAKFDKGSVSVTADGTKTISQLLTELYALIDTTKVTANMTLRHTSGNVTTIYTLSIMDTTNGLYRFGNSTTNGTLITVNTAIIQSNLKTITAFDVTIANNTVDAGNLGANVRPAGDIYAIYY